jgi:DNA invertase Pin-like site-specific DNA recombinase
VNHDTRSLSNDQPSVGLATNCVLNERECQGSTINGNVVAYYRVATDRRSRSGLGLEAQQQAVRTYLNGSEWTLLGEFTEVESGKGRARPELAKAMALCMQHKATLVIARLDRLSRNVAFISGLMAGTENRFVSLDRPEASPFELHSYAAVAEQEARAISARTRAALQAAKARGVRLGRPRGAR